MARLDQLHRDNPFDRFQVCFAYQALENDWNVGGWVRERPSNQRRMESIGVQLSRIKFSAGHQGGSFDALLPLDGDEDNDEFDGARETYIHALIAWCLAPQVDPADALGAYIRKTYVAEFVAEHFPQLVA